MHSTPPGNLPDAALFYADNGIYVLPLHTMGLVPSQSSEATPQYVPACDCSAATKALGKCTPAKHPVSDLVPHGVLDASIDQATIRAWWRERPEANIGGALWQSGLVDIAPDSVEWWAEFKARGLPDTAHFASGGGAGHEHWLYQRGDLPRVQINRTGLYDIMTAGYAVMPPSRHRSGNPYQWVEWRPPIGHPLWLTEMVARQRDDASVSTDPVIPAETGEPPIALNPEQLAIWEGRGPSNDRSNTLVDIARMLGEAGYQDVEGIASRLAERDITLDMHKYSHRSNASVRYRAIAEQYGKPPLYAKLGKASVPVPGMRWEQEQVDGRGGHSPKGSEGRDPLRWRNHRQTVDLLPPDIDWFIDGVLGRGLITELVAKVKLGKTTFMLQGIRAGIAGDAEYCGRAVKPLRAAYVTEEGYQTFQIAMHRYGLNDLVDHDAFFTVFDFETEQVDPRKNNLPFVVDSLIRHCAEDHIDVVILDTISIIAGLDEEDHSGKAAGVMAEIRRLATAGLAVAILRHSRKSGGDVGDAGRGSSAISGYCDILLQIEPFKGDEETTSARVMRTKSRLGVYEPLMLSFDKLTERYASVGTLLTSEERLKAAVLKALEDLGAIDEANAKTSLEVTARSGKRKQAVTDTLKLLVAEGKVASKYVGKSVVYWLKQVIHLHHEPVPEQWEQEKQSEQEDLHIPYGDVAETPSVPDFSLSLKGEKSGNRKPEPTPEQVAKRAAERAERERLRLEAADAAAPKIEYLAVRDDAALVEALARLSPAAVGLDTETTGLNAHRDRLRTVNLSDGETHVVVDSWGITDWSPLQRYLDGLTTVRMHTYLFDLAFLQQVGVSVDPQKIIDVRTMSVVLEAQEDHVDYRLQAIAKRHLDEHVSKVEQKRGWDAPELRHAKLAYAAEDARVTYAAADALEAKLLADPDLDGLSYCLALEQDVQAATWWLASAGVPCDVGMLREAIAEQEALIAERLKTLKGLAGVDDINWRSPSQVLPILQDRGLEIEGTSVNHLMQALSDDPIIDALLGYRSAGTCLGLLNRTLSAVAPDGRIYASYHPIGAQTGRTSCSEPNLQQLPHETRARAAIRPGPGRVFVRADYSQLQIVIAAWLSQDERMRRILNAPGGDIHSATAAAVGCSRQQAKAINFGFLFGAGPETFRREQRKNGIVLSEDQAREYRNTFMNTYPGIRRWHRSLGEWNTEAEVIDDTGSGRRRSRIFSNNVKANTPVQMAEAHGFKRALIALHNDRHTVPSARLVMMVHDELVAECDHADRYLVAQWLQQHMVDAMQPLVDGVRVEVEATIVPSYHDDDKQQGEKV
jgi:DNA polymerase-1